MKMQYKVIAEMSDGTYYAGPENGMFRLYHKLEFARSLYDRIVINGCDGWYFGGPNGVKFTTFYISKTVENLEFMYDTPFENKVVGGPIDCLIRRRSFQFAGQEQQALGVAGMEVIKKLKNKKAAKPNEYIQKCSKCGSIWGDNFKSKCPYCGGLGRDPVEFCEWINQQAKFLR